MHIDKELLNQKKYNSSNRVLQLLERSILPILMRHDCIMCWREWYLLDNVFKIKGAH